MGNRAVITTRSNFERNGIGVYLHWNGGRDSVEAFLKYMKLRGFRPPDQDCYGWARLCQVIGNYIGGELSIGIDTVNNLDMDNWDNGVYIIEGWEIVGREYFHGSEQHGHNIDELLNDIDESQPQMDRIGKELCSAVTSIPCDFCCYNPPSSADDKPCRICPARAVMSLNDI